MIFLKKVGIKTAILGNFFVSNKDEKKEVKNTINETVLFMDDPKW